MLSPPWGVVAGEGLSLLVELRAATRVHHVALEDALPLMRAGLTEATYVTILERFLGIYAPLESAVMRYENALVNMGIDVQIRRKDHLLKQDLVALGMAPIDVAHVEHASVPVLDSPAAALGVMYVTEGATLGGQIISRHLQMTLGLTPERGGAFFAAYGSDAGARWRAFTQAIRTTSAAQDAHAAQAAAAAAVATFQLFLDFAVPKDVVP